jgi:hypothetical protein
MSLLKVNNIQNILGQPNLGKILQVTQLYYDTVIGQSITLGQYTDIFGMSLSITPSSTNSKILVYCKWFGESAQPENMGFGIKRNGTIIGVPSPAGARASVMAVANINYGAAADNNSTPEMAQFWYLDSPISTSTLTYNMWTSNAVSTTLWTNRTTGDVDQFGYERGCSIIILMEVGA